MNILILGCSFGVPNYWGSPELKDLQYGVSPKTHTEFLLKDLGHNVYNCSRNGGSNLGSLDRAKKYLAGIPIRHPCHGELDFNVMINSPEKNLKIDWIIWFHTELHRDRQSVPGLIKDPIKDEETIARYIYPQFAEFQQHLESKMAVIGGAGDVHPSYCDYLQPDFVIKSWRREILNLNAPVSNTLWQQDVIVDSAISTKDKIDLIDDNLRIKKLLENSPEFPDRCHPGPNAHKNLVERLKKLF